MRLLISFAYGINLYNSLPLPIQGVIGNILAPIPLRRRGHRGVFKLAEEISLPTSWEKMESATNRRLSDLIIHSAANVPWFGNLLNETGIDPRAVKSIDDLQTLPVLTKEDVREHAMLLRADNSDQYSPGAVRTSGSTGEPLEFLVDQRTRLCEYASEWRCLMENGATPGDRTATFRGNHYRNHRRQGTHWFRHALSGDLNFNTFAMTPESCEKYIHKLRRYNPKIYRGFPSSLSHLAKHVHGPIISPSAIAFCSSEMMDDQMVENIRSNICDTIVNWYSQSEYVVSAGTCREGNMHVNTEFGILEVLDEDGTPVPEGTVGRLVGTSLTNFSQPFIRYDLDDLGALSFRSCLCGRPHPILEKISGRTSDVIITPDGRNLSTVQMQHWWKHQAVLEWELDVFEWIQLVQTGLSEVTARSVPKEGVEPLAHIDSLQGALSDLWGVEVSVTIDELESIPHGEKWRFSHSIVDGGRWGLRIG